MSGTPKWENSDSLLWVDGNTNDSYVDIPAGTPCTYNVNDPTGWLPMSVISGLASGYCERRAQLTTNFNGTTWNDANSATIVNRCAHGMALGKTGTAMFAAGNDATFSYPVTGATNYMVAMDTAIVGLITGTAKFVKPDGQPYLANNNAFSGLAVAAQSRAVDGGSSILLPTSGGAAYRSQMMPAYPAAWAKERKWMLDELRYTGQNTGPTANEPVRSAYAYMLEYSAKNAEAATQAGIQAAIVESATDMGTYERGMFANSGTFLDYEKNLTTPLYSAGQNSASYMPYGIFVTVPNVAVGAAVTVSSYMIPPTYEQDDAVMAFGATEHIRQAAGVQVIEAKANTRYIVSSGATAFFSSSTNNQIDSFDVRSGGTALFDTALTGQANGGNIDSGGVVLPGTAAGAITRTNGNTYTDGVCVNRSFDYKPVGGYEQYVFRNNGTISPIGDALDYRVEGGTVALAASAEVGIIEVGAGGLLHNTGRANMARLVACSGGTISLTKIITGQRIYVTKGGQVSITSTCEAAVGRTNVIVCSGGTLSLSGAAGIGTLSIEEGAIINIAATSIVNGALINSDNEPICTDVVFNMFNPLQFTTLTSGWNTLNGTVGSVAGTAPVVGSALVLGAATAPSDIRTQLQAVTLKAPTDAAYAVATLGVTTVGANTTYNGYSFAAVLNNVRTRNGYNIGIMYGKGTGGTSVVNHYQDFRVRQWATDPSAS